MPQTLPNATDLHTLYQAYTHASSVSTDTRSLQVGALFFALVGPTFDGNRFALQALAQGAHRAVVSDPSLANEPNCLWVPDTLVALQALARYHRQQLGIPVVAITGSNGKTTTKELLRHILGTRFQVFVTPGNRNNHIGVPLSLLEITAEHALAVLELGDNHPGEIATLAQLAQPTHGLITNIGEDHLEGYGTLAANAATKLELFDYLVQTGGHCFINAADTWLAPYPATASASTAYNTPESGYTATAVHLSTDGLTVDVRSPRTGETRYSTPMLGTYQVENLLAAVVVAEHMGLTPAEIQRGVLAFQPAANRGQLLVRGHTYLLLDAYNANPSSMRVALADLVRFPQRSPGVVLGDMLELGTFSQAAHRSVGEQLRALPAMPTVLIGPEMETAYQALGRGHWYPSREAAAPHLRANLQGADLVLLKGSRGLALEKLVDLWPDTPTNPS